jgi:hypothetical protein
VRLRGVTNEVKVSEGEGEEAVVGEGEGEGVREAIGTLSEVGGCT